MLKSDCQGLNLFFHTLNGLVDKFLNFSKLDFSHLYNGNDHGTYFINLFLCMIPQKILPAVRQKWNLETVWKCHSVVSDSLQPHGLQPGRLLYPWDFPGKNTGVGCHFLIQGIFLTQRSNPGPPHCRQTLYHLGSKLSKPCDVGKYLTSLSLIIFFK